MQKKFEFFYLRPHCIQTHVHLTPLTLNPIKTKSGMYLHLFINKKLTVPLRAHFLCGRVNLLRQERKKGKRWPPLL